MIGKLLLGSLELERLLGSFGLGHGVVGLLGRGRRHVGLRSRSAWELFDDAFRLFWLRRWLRFQHWRRDLSQYTRIDLQRGLLRARGGIQRIQRAGRQQNRDLAARQFFFFARRYTRRKHLGLEDQKQNEQSVRGKRGDGLDQLGAGMLDRRRLSEELDFTGDENIGVDEVGRKTIRRRDDFGGRGALRNRDALVEFGGLQ